MIISPLSKKAYLVAGALLGLVVGFTAAKLVYKPIQQNSVVVKSEKHEDESINQDGSITFERNTRDVVPGIHRKSLPGIVTRIEKFEVKPDSVKPVKVEMVVSETTTGTRITAHAEGGVITNAEDIVIPRIETRTTIKNPARSILVIRAWSPKNGVDIGVLGSWEKGRIVVSGGYLFSSQTAFVGVGYRF